MSRDLRKAREIAREACARAFETAAEQRACSLGTSLMETALSEKEAVVAELGRIPRGFRETKKTRIQCAPGSMRTISPNKNTRLLVCCPKGHENRKTGRCKVGTRMKAEFKRR